MSVLSPSTASTHTSPPRPPSPPFGPPNSMNFSRRKATQPLPPSPLLVKIFASSRNCMGSASGSTEGLEAAHENGGTAAHSPVRERRYREDRKSTRLNSRH